MATAILKSPRDSTVIAINTGSGVSVLPNQPLMMLDSSAEQKLLAHLSSKEASIRAHLDAISEDKAKNQLDVLQAIIGNDLQIENDYVYTYGAKEVSYGVGLLSLEDLLGEEAKTFKSRLDRLQAQVKLQQVTKANDIARRYLSVVLKLLAAEKVYANQKITELTIAAPVGGVVQLFVGGNTPVRRGFVLCQIS